MARHLDSCGAIRPRGCRPNCSCWCHQCQRCGKYKNLIHLVKKTKDSKTERVCIDCIK